ncbi:uncharacterized protein LOC143305420 [Osmia lignaria lignaria]|uniref:uncharacterized protein LOC143305420 n=1 Tax=Osmia lignaria lignaria TaxID=1437193 RepID=UPI00402B3E67
MKFCNGEKVDMLLVYGECHKNAIRAKVVYAERQINLKNIHYWVSENPHWMREVDHQRQWSVNMWYGIQGNQLIGPHFIDDRLTGQKYVTGYRRGLPAQPYRSAFGVSRPGISSLARPFASRVRSARGRPLSAARVLAARVPAGPAVSRPRTPHKYANILNDTLPSLLDNVPLNIRQQIWYQHDGCPAHYALNVRQVLDRKFPNRWIGRGG